jgi:hypothetical protein
MMCGDTVEYRCRSGSLQLRHRQWQANALPFHTSDRVYDAVLRQDVSPTPDESSCFQFFVVIPAMTPTNPESLFRL